MITVTTQEDLTRGRTVPAEAGPRRLAELVEDSERLLVLTGAGCSTESGIPDYRDRHGEWKHARPVQYQDFVGSADVRRRYWARSLIGWQRVAAARPNGAHHALARLEASGRLACLITQNVDGLHQKAGSSDVIDLHGRLDTVDCLECGRCSPREDLQTSLERLNPGWRAQTAATAPDGDVDLGDAEYDAFAVPDCPVCGGVLKPSVVFFGEMVPRHRTAEALTQLERADALLVVGSSLMVWSGYRFARGAAERGLPVAAVNLGRTRADEQITLKVAAPCGEVLPRMVEYLGL